MSIPFRGTRDGVPRLLELLGRHGIQASFFFQRRAGHYGAPPWRLVNAEVSVEDAAFQSRLAVRLGYSAGRHRLAGRRIGAGNEAVIRAAAESREVGLHAWDHYSWQAWSGVWPQERLALEVERGLLELERIIGRPVTCSTVSWLARRSAGWLKPKNPSIFSTTATVAARGRFAPARQRAFPVPVQIPVTLPTWDEAVGTAVDIAEL
ncbi:polysaccharide deacetylase family protein [Klebsiella pneumoniae subsp. pneumoniae]|nr:polysaccharide deacetylase family protein [Klebsiella pneumoniae subsp. pneumoniae]